MVCAHSSTALHVCAYTHARYACALYPCPLWACTYTPAMHGCAWPYVHIGHACPPAWGRMCLPCPALPSTRWPPWCWQAGSPPRVALPWWLALVVALVVARPWGRRPPAGGEQTRGNGRTGQLCAPGYPVGGLTPQPWSKGRETYGSSVYGQAGGHYGHMPWSGARHGTRMSSDLAPLPALGSAPRCPRVVSDAAANTGPIRWSAGKIGR